jgi:hypothetical protein
LDFGFGFLSAGGYRNWHDTQANKAKQLCDWRDSFQRHDRFWVETQWQIHTKRSGCAFCDWV